MIIKNNKISIMKEKMFLKMISKKDMVKVETLFKRDCSTWMLGGSELSYQKFNVVYFLNGHTVFRGSKAIYNTVNSIF